MQSETQSYHLASLEGNEGLRLARQAISIIDPRKTSFVGAREGEEARAHGWTDEHHAGGFLFATNNDGYISSLPKEYLYLHDRYGPDFADAECATCIITS